MKRFAGMVVIALAVGCGGSTDSTGSSNGGTGGATGGTGGSGNIGGATGGVGNVGGSTGGVGNIGGSTGGVGNIGGSTGGVGNVGGSTGGTGNVGGSPGIECNPGTVTCFGIPPDCQPGEVPSVQNGCWGPCVPILSCATEPNCDNCKTGFCAAYQAFTTEYRCVSPSIQCQALACSCLAQYFCVDTYSGCSVTPGGTPPVTCSCPTC